MNVMSALIDFDSHSIKKIVPTIRQAEYWAALLCKDRTHGIYAFTTEGLACLSANDLRKLHDKNVRTTAGREISREGLAARIISNYRPDTVDRTEVDVLQAKLGLPLQFADGIHELAGDTLASLGRIAAPSNAEEFSVSKKAAKKVVSKTATKKIPVDRVEQNGILRPRSGGKCARVWEIADSVSKRARKPAELSAVTAIADNEGLNPTNTRIEYQRWRTFNGLTTSRRKKEAA